MKLVKENIDFKRGRKPSEALGIGLGQSIKKPWKLSNLPVGFFMAKSGDKTMIIEVPYGELAKGYTMWKDPKEAKYTFWRGDVNIPSFRFWITSHEVDELRYLGDTIPERFRDFIDENLDFRRGVDPRKSLDVGIKRERTLEELENDLATDLKKYMMPLSKRPFVFSKINRWFTATGEPSMPSDVKVMAWFNDYSTSPKFYAEFKKDFKQWIKEHTDFKVGRIRKHFHGYIDIWLRLPEDEDN